MLHKRFPHLTFELLFKEFISNTQPRGCWFEFQAVCTGQEALQEFKTRQQNCLDNEIVRLLESSTLLQEFAVGTSSRNFQSEHRTSQGRPILISLIILLLEDCVAQCKSATILSWTSQWPSTRSNCRARRIQGLAQTGTSLRQAISRSLRCSLECSLRCLFGFSFWFYLRCSLRRSNLELLRSCYWPNLGQVVWNGSPALNNCECPSSSAEFSPDKCWANRWASWIVHLNKVLTCAVFARRFRRIQIDIINQRRAARVTMAGNHGRVSFWSTCPTIVLDV